MKILIKKYLIIILCIAFCFLSACSSRNVEKAFVLYGTPTYSLSPIIHIQTILGGSNDDYVFEVLYCDNYIYVIGETNSNDGSFTSSSDGHKLFLAVLNNKGQFLKCLTFGKSNTKNKYVKAKVINTYIYVLSDCSLETQSVVLYKIDLNNNSVHNTVLGSLLVDENALDLIEWKDSIFVIGQAYDNTSSCKSLFITRLDYSLKQKHYERIIRAADLTYIGTESSSNSLKVWINAVAISYSYPAMIDISKDNYVYNNFESQLLSYRLLNIASINDNVLLVLSNEKLNNSAAYVFYCSNSFEKINNLDIENITHAKIAPIKDNALVSFYGRTSLYYLINKDVKLPQNELSKKNATCEKSLSISTGTLIMTKNNNCYELLYINKLKTKIMNLGNYDNINSFCVFKDFLIIASNEKNDIKISFSKIMPYYFI